MSGDEKRINPQIREVDIGIRDLRKISIYPMAMADQTRFIKLIEEAINKYFEYSGGEELSKEHLMPFLSSLVDLIGKNINDFIEIVLDPEQMAPKEFFKNVTNTQMSVILNHIVEDNFGESLKNVMGLGDRFKSLFLLKRPSPQSLNDTLNMTSDTSIEEASEMED